MRLKLEVDASGLQKATAQFARAARDYRPVWPRVAGVIYEDLRERFETGGRGQWPPLSESYRAWKLRHYPSSGIGVRTGDLMRSVISQTNPNAIYKEGRLLLTIGTSVPYAKLFDEGWASKKTRAKAPPRPIYVISSTGERAANEQLFEYLAGEAKEAGFEVRRS